MWFEIKLFPNPLARQEFILALGHQAVRYTEPCAVENIVCNLSERSTSAPSCTEAWIFQRNDLIHKSHNAPVSYTAMQHFVTEMCIMGSLSNILWDLWDWSIGSILNTKLQLPPRFASPGRQQPWHWPSTSSNDASRVLSLRKKTSSRCEKWEKMQTDFCFMVQPIKGE